MPGWKSLEAALEAEMAKEQVYGPRYSQTEEDKKKMTEKLKELMEKINKVKEEQIKKGEEKEKEKNSRFYNIDLE